jgi:tRNA pseudouridine38-40 synthase
LESCHPRFHARLNATSKTYQYRIDCSPYGNLFLRNTTHHIPEPLNLDAMKKGASLLIGTYDFKSFCSNKRFKKSSIRTIYSITLEKDENTQLITLTYTGNGFLYNMVRIMTGTLIEIGLGIRTPEEIPLILEGRNRGLAGHTAPPQGLFLLSVDYNAQESLS